MHNGSAPAAEDFIRKMKLRYLRVLRQQRVDRTAQVANTFPVDDSHPENSASLTLCEIISDEILHLAWAKRLQIQDAVNRQLDGLVVAHRNRLTTDGHGWARFFFFATGFLHLGTPVSDPARGGTQRIAPDRKSAVRVGPVFWKWLWRSAQL